MRRSALAMRKTRRLAWTPLAGGFSPRSIANINLWFRSDLGVSLNGSNVSAWADQSGNAFDLAQGTAANQPAYAASDGNFNGKPSITFDDSNDVLLTAATTVCPGKHTTFLVGQVNTAFGYVWSFGAPEVYMIYPATNTLQYRDGSGFTSGKDASAGWWGANTKLIRVEYDATHASHKLYKNGVEVSTSTGSSNSDTDGADQTNKTFGLGASYAGSFHSDLVCAEFIQYRRVLTAAEILQVEAYLTSRYAIA